MNTVPVAVAVGRLDLAPICLGANVFGWTADEPTSWAVLDAVAAAAQGWGLSILIDTADVYSAWVPGNSGGESEQIIGAWRAARPAELTGVLAIATKVAKHPQRRGLSAATLRDAVDDSRRRLRVEQLDLYYAHEDDPLLAPEQIAEHFAALQRSGAIGQWALSNVGPARTRAIAEAATRLGLPGPVALQPQHSLVHRSDVDGEDGVGVVAEELGLAVLPYYALAAGFLTGKYSRDQLGRTPGTARGGRVAAYLTEAGFALLDVLTAVATEQAVPPASVALAWLRSRPQVAAPIASASRVEQVPALLAGATVQLTAEQTERLDAASTAFVAGAGRGGNR